MALTFDWKIRSALLIVLLPYIAVTFKDYGEAIGIVQQEPLPLNAVISLPRDQVFDLLVDYAGLPPEQCAVRCTIEGNDGGSSSNEKIILSLERPHLASIRILRPDGSTDFTIMYALTDVGSATQITAGAQFESEQDADRRRLFEARYQSWGRESFDDLIKEIRTRAAG